MARHVDDRGDLCTLWPVTLLRGCIVSIFSHLANPTLSHSEMGTYVCAVRVGNRRGDLEPERGDAHAERCADPAARLDMAEADAVDDGADGEKQRKPQGVQSRLGKTLAPVLPGVAVHEPVDEPTRRGFAEDVSDQERDAEDEPRPDDVELVQRRVDDRTRRGEQHAPVRETGHVVQSREDNAEIFHHGDGPEPVLRRQMPGRLSSADDQERQE